MRFQVPFPILWIFRRDASLRCAAKDVYKRQVLDDGNGCYFNDQYTAEVLRETLLDPNTGFRYKRPVVCGPYQLKNVDIGSETVELEINKEYLGRYDGTKPHVETIISKPIATETWRDEFEKGTVDYFYSSKGETLSLIHISGGGKRFYPGSVQRDGNVLFQELEDH